MAHSLWEFHLSSYLPLEGDIKDVDGFGVQSSIGLKDGRKLGYTEYGSPN